MKSLLLILGIVVIGNVPSGETGKVKGTILSYPNGKCVKCDICMLNVVQSNGAFTCNYCMFIDGKYCGFGGEKIRRIRQAGDPNLIVDKKVVQTANTKEGGPMVGINLQKQKSQGTIGIKSSSVLQYPGGYSAVGVSVTQNNVSGRKY